MKKTITIIALLAFGHCTASSPKKKETSVRQKKLLKYSFNLELHNLQRDDNPLNGYESDSDKQTQKLKSVAEKQSKKSKSNTN